jgi:hypothetical protein
MTVPQTRQATVVILWSKDADLESGVAVETIQARTMASTLQISESRRKASLSEACSAPNGGFKRLALPAVAAAVQTLGGNKGRPVVHQDWSARPRRDGKPS